MPWDIFTQTVEDAQKLAHDASFDHLALVGNHYGQLRRYAPTFLEALEFHGAPATRPLLAAIETLKVLNATESPSSSELCADEFRAPALGSARGAETALRSANSTSCAP